MPSVRVRTPATSANLGPGFDCLGLAVALRNEVTVTWGDAVARDRVTITGEGAQGLDDASNATLASLRLGLTWLERAIVPVHLKMHNRIPLARGLGSSAAAIVAGLAAARAVAGCDPLDRSWILEQALRIEPHPDNLAAAVFGGLTAAVLVDDTAVRCLPMGRPRGLRVAFAVPSHHVSTREARTALPAQYSRADATFSSSRAALLVGALLNGAHDLLDEAVRDRLHTPARAGLIGPWDEVRAAALEAGARGVFISGSGPTVGAFVPGQTADARRVAQAMAHAFARAGVAAVPLWPAIAAHGVEVEPVAP